MKAVHHVLVSRAETIGTFNTGFDTVNLHRPAAVQHAQEVVFFAQDARDDVVLVEVADDAQPRGGRAAGSLRTSTRTEIGA